MDMPDASETDIQQQQEEEDLIFVDEKLSKYISQLWFDDEGIETKTSIDQREVEEECFPFLQDVLLIQQDFEHHELYMKFTLEKERHIRYISKMLKGLPKGYVSLDASQPWISYWSLHALNLLGVELSLELKLKALNTLRNCYNDEDGGFGGGFGQTSHLATTYAAVHAIAILQIKEAYTLLNREKLFTFFMSLKQPNGSFTMQKNGEIDVRGVYCVVSVAKLLNILTDELIEKVPDFVADCQTYQGGISGSPGAEAHGGYTFCAVAAMEIMDQVEKLRIKDLAIWSLSRQMRLEGGFNGRTNKLVDGCYSFWMGSLFPILQQYLPDLQYNANQLQTYILLCCQAEKGGLRDKPSKSPDLYHTCYCLSGLSTAQYIYNKDESQVGNFNVVAKRIVGGETNELVKIFL